MTSLVHITCECMIGYPARMREDQLVSRAAVTEPKAPRCSTICTGFTNLDFKQTIPTERVNVDLFKN